MKVQYQTKKAQFQVAMLEMLQYRLLVKQPEKEEILIAEQSFHQSIFVTFESPVYITILPQFKDLTTDIVTVARSS